MLVSRNTILKLEDCVEQTAARSKRVARRAFGKVATSEHTSKPNATDDPRYHEWFLSRRATAEELEEQRRMSATFSASFSIIVPLYKTPLVLFDEMIASVKSQSYEKWQLVLVNASPEDPLLASRVQEAAEKDVRITVVTLDENRGITANTNEGVAAAQGDYVCFFDHDDLLEPDALYEYALAIENNPDIGMLYCDEDKVDEQGCFIEPHFKPDFNIDLLRSNNYICHFLCIRKSLLDEIGPNDPIFDGAQDHALTLRVSELTDFIAHVRKILYHWRVTENSTASREAVGKQGVKSYANEAGRAAVQAHLDRLGIKGTVHPVEGLPFRHEIDYVIEGEPLVSIVIIGRNNRETARCARSITLHSVYRRFEIVESAPSAGERYCFPQLANKGATRAKGVYLLFLDAGIRLVPECETNPIGLLLGPCQRNDVGTVTGRLLAYDNTIYQAGMVACDSGKPPVSANLGMPGFELGYFCYNVLARDYSFASGRYMMTHRGTFEAVGGFDTRFKEAYFGANFCLKLGATGYLTVYEPRAIMRLTESSSRHLPGFANSTPEFASDGATLLERWPQFFSQCDPNYNPNLIRPTMNLRVDR